MTGVQTCALPIYNLIKGITWTEFVTGIPRDTMPELVQYLKERRLYVNEPVAAEEEV